MKVLTIVGNRPQFIKAAPISLALRAAGVDEVSLHSGQHYDTEMSRVFYEQLALPQPAYSLDLRTADTELLETGIAAAVDRERPDWVVVFGDTNTTLAGARAAVAAGVPLAHVEAGLRSGDLGMPEERNRIEVDRLSQLLFCPDEHSRTTLEIERVGGQALLVGDVMADATRLFAPIARERVPPGLAPRSYLVLTIHREANVQEPRLRRIVEGVNGLAEPVIFPAHPRTRDSLERYKLQLGSHVDLVLPLGYLELTALVSQARAVLTDSGGLQKEAYWHGVPCVTLRPSTEWVDTVRVGANTLVDDDPAALIAAVAAARMPADLPTLYGDGYASARVTEALLCTIPRR